PGERQRLVDADPVDDGALVGLAWLQELPEWVARRVRHDAAPRVIQDQKPARGIEHQGSTVAQHVPAASEDRDATVRRHAEQMVPSRLRDVEVARSGIPRQAARLERYGG